MDEKKSKVYDKAETLHALTEIALAAEGYTSCMAEFDGYPQYCNEYAEALDGALNRHRDLVASLKFALLRREMDEQKKRGPTYRIEDCV